MQNNNYPEMDKYLNLQDRKEDHFVISTLIVDGVEVPDIPCKVYLPQIYTEKPRLEFKPTLDQYYKILSRDRGSFSAELKRLGGGKYGNIHAPLVYLQEQHLAHWGDDISEPSFSGEPQDLIITEYLHSPGLSQVTKLVFWISPNSLLAPPMAFTRSYTGDVNITRVYQLEIQLTKDTRLTFDSHFRSEKLSENENLTRSHLIACTETTIPAHDVEAIKQNLLPALNDFLLIASFGSRTNTACLGWEASDGESVTTFYRGKYSFPKGLKEPTIHDGLVAIKDFQEFVKVCYQSFTSYSARSDLRTVIRILFGERRRTVEETFIKLFSGLEKLMLDYRDKRGLKNVFDPVKEWPEKKEKIKSLIKSSKEFNRKERKKLCNKLEELNRIPFRVAFEDFCINNGINLSDLWPVFSSDDLVSLSEIRNLIIHGDFIESGYLESLAVAMNNLKWCIERILVTLLAWPVCKTEVAPDFLKNLMNDMQVTERKKLTNIIKENGR